MFRTIIMFHLPFEFVIVGFELPYPDDEDWRESDLLFTFLSLVRSGLFFSHAFSWLSFSSCTMSVVFELVIMEEGEELSDWVDATANTDEVGSWRTAVGKMLSSSLYKGLVLENMKEY